MTNPVMMVRRQVKHGTDEPIGRGCWLWCPGCREAHRPQIVGEAGEIPMTPGPNGTWIASPCWTWDGNLEKPTFNPSLLVTLREGVTCHSFIVAGNWQFLPDCWHPLAGQTVPLPPLPDWLCG